MYGSELRLAYISNVCVPSLPIAMVSPSKDETAWLALQNVLSNAIYNWDGIRPYEPSLAKRTEGFTERWGDHDDKLTSEPPKAL